MTCGCVSMKLQSFNANDGSIMLWIGCFLSASHISLTSAEVLYIFVFVWWIILVVRILE